MKAYLVKLIALSLAIIILLSSFVSCGDSVSNITESPTSSADQTDFSTEEITETPAESDTTQDKPSSEVTTGVSTIDEITVEETVTEAATTEAVTTEETTTEIKETKLAYDAYSNDLCIDMQYIFTGKEVYEETLMFIDYGDVKSLLYPADDIISITSYDRKITYVEGVDYVLTNGKIKILEGSSMPCITSEVYYGPHNSDRLWVWQNGQKVNVYYAEGEPMVEWQVRVTYKHSKSWNGFAQESMIDVYESFVNKLIKGEDVTVFFYGDSITRGSNSSFHLNIEPYTYSYPLLFTYALADLFDYTVTHKYARAQGTFGSEGATKPYEKLSDYVAGDRGTITFINAARGSWKVEDGIDNFDLYVKRWVEDIGCDLFVCAFGMNNSGSSLDIFTDNTGTLIDKVLELAPDTSVMIVSTMTPNPDAPSWCGSQPKYEPYLVELAKQYQEEGVACAVAQVTSVSQAIIKKKDFHDHTGNNINHPNDFLCRLYAQTLLQTLIGYENLK